jgi:hypothetical protein
MYINVYLKEYLQLSYYESNVQITLPVHLSQQTMKNKKVTISHHKQNQKIQMFVKVF